MGTQDIHFSAEDTMTRKLLLIGLALTVALAGCAETQMNKTQKGAAIGTGTGAAAGALLGQAIGHNTKSTLIGAAAGALVGGLAGGAIGNYMDKQEQALRQAYSASDAASVQRSQNVLAVTFKADVLFDVNSATLKPGAYPEIDRAAQVLRDYPDTRIQVEGHTDSTGSEQSNMDLSQRRAEAVKTALTSRGVDPARVQAIGYGETMPIATNDTESGRQLNRRVTIRIAPNQS